MIGIQNVMGLGKQLVLKWVVPRNINLKKKKKKLPQTLHTLIWVEGR